MPIDKPQDTENPKKRTYSRNGCIQCKKRKYKCDEGKPSCKNCITSKKECSYRQILKFKDSRSLILKGAILSQVGESKHLEEGNVGLPESQSSATIPKRTIPLSKPSTDPFLNLIPQVVQNSLGSTQQQSIPNLQNSNPIPNLDFIPTTTNSDLQEQFQNPASQIDLENSLFSGATNLITDLNGLISSLEIDFNTLDFQTSLNHNNSNKNNNSINNKNNNMINTSNSPSTNLNGLPSSVSSPFQNNNSHPFTPSLSNIRFEGISPTNYSINSSDNQVLTPNFNDIRQNIQLQKSSPDPSNSSIKKFTNKRINSDTTDNFQERKRKKENLSQNETININYQDENEEEEEEEEKDDDDDDDDDDDSGDDDDDEDEDEERIKESNNNYIQTLTQSLADYGSPKNLSSIKSPANDPLQSSPPNASRSYFNRHISENSKAFPCPNIKDILPFDYIEMLNKTFSNEDIEQLASFFNWQLNSSHVKYLKIFVTNINPNIIPFTTNYAHNAYIRIFLQQSKNSPHLLFAILAISARFEVYQIEQHPELSNYEEKLNYHRTFRTYYLSSCLKSLESVLHSKQTTLNNIESLLLTIQVLASDFSGHKGSQWRTHLHGAKDLLIKYCRYRPLSLELTIVWLWFYSMEVLASLTAPHGGTIHDFDDLDEFLPVLCPETPLYMKYLKKNTRLYENQQTDLFEPGKLTNSLVHFGIAINGKLEGGGSSRYNMYLGYDETILQLFNALVYTIECIKSKDNTDKSMKAEIYERKILNSEGDSLNSEFLLTLFSLISKARSFKYINNEPPYIIPLGQGVHPSELIQNILDHDNDKYGNNNNDNGDNKKNKNLILENVYISAYIHPSQTTNDNSEQTGNLSDSPNAVYSSKSSSPLSNESTKINNINQKNLELNQKQNDDQGHDDAGDITKEIYFSWIDLSQQLNADASYLRLLTLHGGISKYGLGIKSPLIQDIVSRMIIGLYGLVRYREETAEEYDYNGNDKMELLNKRYETIISDVDIPVKETVLDSVKELSNWPVFPFDKYLNYQFDNRLVMIPWALYICGLCCLEPRHKAIIECCFSGLIELGVGSGELSLKKLRKIWTLQKLDRFDYDKFNLFGEGFDDDEEDDYVPFM